LPLATKQEIEFCQAVGHEGKYVFLSGVKPKFADNSARRVFNQLMALLSSYKYFLITSAPESRKESHR
jgi:hypothetical protein